jgi:hypothetical protein
MFSSLKRTFTYLKFYNDIRVKRYIYVRKIDLGAGKTGRKVMILQGWTTCKTILWEGKPLIVSQLLGTLCCKHLQNHINYITKRLSLCL